MNNNIIVGKTIHIKRQSGYVDLSGLKESIQSHCNWILSKKEKDPNKKILRLLKTTGFSQISEDEIQGLLGEANNITGLLKTILQTNDRLTFVNFKFLVNSIKSLSFNDIKEVLENSNPAANFSMEKLLIETIPPLTDKEEYIEGVYNNSNISFEVKYLLTEKSISQIKNIKCFNDVGINNLSHRDNLMLFTMLSLGNSSLDLRDHSYLSNIYEYMLKNKDISYDEANEHFSKETFTKLESRGILGDKYEESDILERGKILTEKQINSIDNQYTDIINHLNINLSKNKLNLYTRFGNTINYGPVAESLIHFAHMLSEGNYFKYFKGIQITPDKGGKAPSNNIIGKEGIHFSNVSGDEFKVSSSIGTSTFFLSHSTNELLSNSPSIYSKAMQERYEREKTNSPDTHIGKQFTGSQIELEDYLLKNKESTLIKKGELEEIFTEFIRNIRELEEKIDTYLQVKS